MSDTQQPEAVWFFPEKKSNKKKIWLIVALSVAALAIVGVLLFLFLPRADAPAPQPTATVSATPSATPTPTPSAPEEPATTPPPVPDQNLDTFVGQVQPWLDDASRGLGMLAGLDGQDGVQVIDVLQQDAERLSDAIAPASLAESWPAGVSDYSARLAELRTASESGGATQGAVEAATAALQQLRTLIGI